MSEASRTTDHGTIRKWAEERGGRPATVAATGGQDDPGILRIDFNEPAEGLEDVDWDKFFETFEERKLAFLYQDRTSDGKTSRFFKFVHR